MKLNTNCGNQNRIINLKTYLFCVCAAFLILAFLIQHFCQRLCDIPGWFDGENSHFKVQLTGNIKVLLWGGGVPVTFPPHPLYSGECPLLTQCDPPI